MQNSELSGPVWRVSYTTMEWWQRLDQVIKARGLRVDDVAERAGISRQTLYGYLKGPGKGGAANPGGDRVKRLAEAVNMTERQLRDGDIPPNVSGSKWIPVLEMTKLAKLKANESPMSQWDGVSRQPVGPEVSEACFYVRLINNSCAPDFKKGDAIICDPTAKIEPGDYVIAVLSEEQEAHFGQYRPLTHRKSLRFELVHNNKNYPTIEVGGRIKGFILGRAVKHIRDM